MALNAVIIGSCLAYLAEHPARLEAWYHNLTRGEWHLAEAAPLRGHDWPTIALLCLWFFPKLALGLSGFETGVAVMPLIRGAPEDDPDRPRARIRNTRKLLL